MDESASEAIIQDLSVTEDNVDEAQSSAIINEVQEKHENQKARRENPGDIIIVQITVCIIILLIIAAANIIRSGFAEMFAQYFREMTEKAPEKIIQDAVSEAVRLIDANSR